MSPDHSPSPFSPASGRMPSGTAYGDLLASLRRQNPWATHAPAAVPASAAKGGPSPRPGPGPAAGHASSWRSVAEQVDAHAERDPDAIALSHRDGSVTYGELRERSDAGAARLAGHDAAAGDLVAVVLDRGPEFVIAVLALWKLGAAYLPLDTAQPTAWRADVAARAGVRLLIADDPAAAVPGVAFADAGALLARDSAGRSSGARVRGTSRPEDLAYVIATSGSTGAPKLVMVEQRGVAALADAQRDFFGSVPVHERILQFFHPSYDAALFDIVLALTNGARLEIAQPGVLAGSEPLAGFLRARKIGFAVLPAAVLRTLRSDTLPGLRTVVSMGDVCTPQTAREWGVGRGFVNGYGPTETTVAATLHRVDPAVDGARERVPIGRPLAGWEIRIIDAEQDPGTPGFSLREVPEGGIGEICIGGPGVGRGYLGEPTMTGLVFAAPNGATDAATARDRAEACGAVRWYRSGDLGRRLPDGTLEFHGRRDDQVKIRGVRIELGHVERALAALPGVRNAAVTVYGGVERGLVGHVELDPGTGPSPTVLRAALASVLPPALVPDRIVVHDALPLLPSGKTDRARLTAASPQTPRPGPPLSPFQEVVARHAAELLGVEAIGVHDDLFAVGAHSLLAAQLAVRVHAELGVEVPTGAVLQARTVAKIAEIAEALPSPASAEPSRAPQAGPRPGAHPAPSFGQRRVHLMERIDPGGRAYHSQAALRFAGPLDTAALDAALTAVTARHDVLRSRFHGTVADPVVVVEPPRPVRVPMTDLSRTEAADLAPAFDEAVRGFVEAPFDLAHDGPARWLLVRLGAEEHVLVHVEHHSAHDGWSFNVFVRELIEGYAQSVAGLPVSRPRPPLQYYDYAAWQRTWIDGPEADAQRAYWRSELRGAPTVLRLPRSAGSGMRTFLGTAPRSEIPAAVAQRLEALAAESGTSLFAVLLAAYFVLLSRYTGSDDILVASGFANRRWRSTHDLLGMFVNTVVLRGRLDGGPTFRDLLGRVGRTTREALDRQELPFEEVLREAGLSDRVPGTNPLVQAAFSFHDTHPGALGRVPLDVTVVEGLSNGSAKFDLSVVAVPRRETGPGGVARLAGDVLHIPRSDDRPLAAGDRGPLAGITVAWEFDATVEEHVAEGLLTGYQELLAAVAEDPATPIADLPVMDAQHVAAVLAAGTGPAGDRPDDLAGGGYWIPAVLARWVERTPDAVAVTWAGGTLTFAELFEAGRALAAGLAGLGVGPADRVAVLAPHEGCLVTAMLGVLLAGGVYVPLDPSSPTPRIAGLVRHAGAGVVIAADSTAESAVAVAVALSEGSAHGLPGATATGVAAPGGVAVIVVDDAGRVPPGEATLAATRISGSVPGTEPGSASAPVPGTGGERPYPIPGGTGSDIAVATFTSGTTGTPKCVLVEHGAIVSRMLDPVVLGTGPGARVAVLASAAFDASCLEIWGGLLSGASVHLLARGWSLAQLARHLVDRRVTHVLLPPAVMPGLARAHPAALAAVGWVGVGGDVLPASAVHDARNAGVANLMNLYGPTEAVVTATAARVSMPASDAAAHAPRTVPIGRPLAGTRVYLLDPEGRLVPPGAVGEIHIGGAALARGYAGDAEATGERFLRDPFDPAGTGRMYRTGDVGRWLPDGALEFLGRRDEQVKIRGIRVELGEVRAALEALPETAEAYVAVDEGADGRRLVGYVLPRPEARTTGRKLRAALSAKAAAHLVPAAIVVVDEWPVNLSGKVDRRRLPRPEADDVAPPGQEPRTETERALAQVVLETLGGRRIGVDEHFFESGLDSLHLMVVAARMETEFGARLGIDDFYTRPTIAGLASALDAGLVGAGGTAGTAGGGTSGPGGFGDPEAGPRPVGRGGRTLS